MTQRASQAEVQLNDHHVTQYISNMQQRDAAIVQNFKLCRDSIMDAAQLYKDENDEALLGKLREQFVGLIQAEHEIEQHKAALQQLQYSYQPSLDKTDFEEALQQRMQQDNFSPEADDDLQLFDELAGDQQQQEEELDEDDDLVVVGNVAKNERCPYTRQELAELKDPVQDQEGFIYERAAIESAIRNEQCSNHSNWVECPVPGVSHAVMLHNLKPVNKRRLQLMAKLRKQQQGATQAERRGVVLDV